MALPGCVRVLAAVSRAAGLLCTLCVVMGLSFACSPIPYNTSSDSPYARPVKPEDLYYEEADQGPPRIEPGDSLEVVVRRGGGGGGPPGGGRGEGRGLVGRPGLAVEDMTPTAERSRTTAPDATRHT